MKVHIKTYGCQMNERDTEMVSALLRRAGYGVTRDENEADVVLVNTCSVRGKAEDKALGKLGLLIASKREHPCRIVGVMGCMVQRMKAEIFRKLPGLDFAVGTHRLLTVPSVLDRVKSGQRPVIDAAESRTGHDPRAYEQGRVSAFVNILFGCNRRCSYCIVPTVRGNECSRPASEIIKEVRCLAAGGVREVTLLGQSVMAYGRANRVWEDGYSSPMGFVEPLPRLLEALDVIPGIKRVRFTPGHPGGCSAEIIDAMHNIKSVCHHLHLPLQSGSDRILELMHRGYTINEYRQVVARLRAAIPTLALTADVIVGFPSEAEKDFELTRAFLHEISFDNVFVFKYNARPGTPAAGLRDDVSAEEKLRRNHVVLTDQNRRSLAKNQNLLGSSVEVLVTGQSRRNVLRWTGRTTGNTIVVFENQTGLKPGDMVEVQIDKATAQTLYGKVLSRGTD